MDKKDKIRFPNWIELREFANSVRFKGDSRRFFEGFTDIIFGFIYIVFAIYFFYTWFENNFDGYVFQILMWKFIGIFLVSSFIIYIVDILYIGDFEITSRGIDIKCKKNKRFIPSKLIKDFEVLPLRRSDKYMLVLVLNQPLYIKNSLIIKRKRFEIIKDLREDSAEYLKKKFDNIIFGNYKPDDEFIEEDENIENNITFKKISQEKTKHKKIKKVNYTKQYKRKKKTN